MGDSDYQATADQVARDLLAKRVLSDSWRKKHNAPEGSYPIPDKQHARSALGFAAMHHGKDSAQYQRVAAKVRTKYGAVSKEWSDEARAAALEARRSKSKSLGQYVAGGPSNLRHKKRERATTLERRKADEQAFYQRASAAAAAVRGSNRSQRQAGIAGAKALAGRGAKPQPQAQPQAKPSAAPATSANGSRRRLTTEEATQRRTTNRPKRLAQLRRAIEHVTDRQEARSDANLREYGAEAGFNYSSRDLVEMYADEVRHDLKNYPKEKHVTIGVPSHGEVRIPRRVAQRHAMLKMARSLLAKRVSSGGPAPQPSGRSLPSPAKASMPPPGDRAKAAFPPSKTVPGPPKDEITTGPGKPPPTPKGLGQAPKKPKTPKHVPGNNGRIDKFLSPGTYNISGWTIPSNVTLTGTSSKTVIGARRQALRKALGDGRSGFIRPGGPVVSDGKGQRSPRIKAGYQLPSLKIKNKSSNSLGGLNNKLRTSFHGNATMGRGGSGDRITARRSLKV